MVTHQQMEMSSAENEWALCDWQLCKCALSLFEMDGLRKLRKHEKIVEVQKLLCFVHFLNI